jgi:hypothetical protein
LFDVLLAFLSLLTGSLLGRIRGGQLSGIVDARIKAKGLLVAGIGATLVLNVLTPSIPMFWLVVAMLSFLGFAAANLTLTGMIVLTIGMVLNLLPVLANGAVPVSELALQSVNVVDASGAAIIDGPRESTATATRLAFLGDVIPVPIVNRVVSLGDLIILVALADLVMNLFLRRRDRDPDDLGVTYAAPTTDEVIDLTDDDDVDHEGPRHAAPGGRVRSHSPRHRRPAHAKPSADDEIDLRPPPLPTENPASAGVETEGRLQADEPAPQTEFPATDESDEVIDLTDRRPIIDLTTSPSDEQLAEFLRRREAADVRATTLAPPSPGHRRNRIRSRRRHHRELAQTDS